MTEKNSNLDSLVNDLLDESKGAAAIVHQEWLLPDGGRDAVFFPPTYPKPQEGFSGEWLGYNIDVLPDWPKGLSGGQRGLASQSPRGALQAPSLQ